MRKVITAEQLQGYRGRSQLVIPSDAILTPSAKETAAEMGLKLLRGEDTNSVSTEFEAAPGRQAPREAAAPLPPQRSKQDRLGSDPVVLCAFGLDARGVLAAICTSIAEQGGNIRDVSQTILQGYFSVILSVDIDTGDTSFQKFKKTIVDVGQSLGLEVSVQRQSIFDAMHRI